MEHREEMNCGGDLCKECWMLEMDKLLRESSSQEMMGGTHTIGCTHFLTLYCC